MKPKLIGITGGIGAGKSTVSTICKHLGFKVYNSDQRAKEIVSEDSIIKKKLISFFGNNIYKKNSFLIDRLGEKIFSDHINISEIPIVEEGLGTRPFDAEGVKTYSKQIISDGVLDTYLLDTYSAKQLNLKSTANSGYSNIQIRSSKPMSENLIESIDSGVLITEMMGSGANLLTGDYSRGAFGYLIEKGKISHPVTNFTIASNMLDMFKNIDEIGCDFYENSKINCGSVLIKDMTIGGN